MLTPQMSAVLCALLRWMIFPPRGSVLKADITHTSVGQSINGLVREKIMADMQERAAAT
jgi:hypothetical protein